MSFASEVSKILGKALAKGGTKDVAKELAKESSSSVSKFIGRMSEGNMKDTFKVAKKISKEGALSNEAMKEGRFLNKSYKDAIKESLEVGRIKTGMRGIARVEVREAGKTNGKAVAKVAKAEEAVIKGEPLKAGKTFGERAKEAWKVVDNGFKPGGVPRKVLSTGKGWTENTVKWAAKNPANALLYAGALYAFYNKFRYGTPIQNSIAGLFQDTSKGNNRPQEPIIKGLVRPLFGDSVYGTTVDTFFGNGASNKSVDMFNQTLSKAGLVMDEAGNLYYATKEAAGGIVNELKNGYLTAKDTISSGISSFSGNGQVGYGSTYVDPSAVNSPFAMQYDPQSGLPLTKPQAMTGGIMGFGRNALASVTGGNPTDAQVLETAAGIAAQFIPGYKIAKLIGLGMLGHGVAGAAKTQAVQQPVQQANQMGYGVAPSPSVATPTYFAPETAEEHPAIHMSR